MKQQRDIDLWRGHYAYLEQFLADNPRNHALLDKLQVRQRLNLAHDKLDELQSPGYLQSLVGTLGADPMAAYAGDG